MVVGRRKIRQLVPTLRSGVAATKQWKGVAWIFPDPDPATSTSSSTEPRRRLPPAIFLTRTHFDIFGLFFPVGVADLQSAVALVTDLYLQAQVTLRLHPSIRVANQPQGSAARWPELWQQELDTLNRSDIARIRS